MLPTRTSVSGVCCVRSVSTACPTSIDWLSLRTSFAVLAFNIMIHSSPSSSRALGRTRKRERSTLIHARVASHTANRTAEMATWAAKQRLKSRPASRPNDRRLAILGFATCQSAICPLLLTGDLLDSQCIPAPVYDCSWLCWMMRSASFTMYTLTTDLVVPHSSLFNFTGRDATWLPIQTSFWATCIQTWQFLGRLPYEST